MLGLSAEVLDADDDRPAAQLVVPGTVHFADDFLGLDVKVLVRLTDDTRHHDPSVDVLEGLAQVDPSDGDVGASLPGAHHRLELVDLRVRTSLVSVQPNTAALVTLVLHLASVCALAPAAAVFFSECETHPAVVGHVSAPEDHHCKENNKKKTL